MGFQLTRNFAQVNDAIPTLSSIVPTDRNLEVAKSKNKTVDRNLLENKRLEKNSLP